MPLILLSGEQVQIDFFNVIRDRNIVAEYFHQGILLATQHMPVKTATIYSNVFSKGISGTHFAASREIITFEIRINDQNTSIDADAFSTEHDGTRIKINYMFQDKIVLSQRTSIHTLQSIAAEIRAKVDS